MFKKLLTPVILQLTRTIDGKEESLFIDINSLASLKELKAILKTEETSELYKALILLLSIKYNARNLNYLVSTGKVNVALPISENQNTDSTYVKLRKGIEDKLKAFKDKIGTVDDLFNRLKIYHGSKDRDIVLNIHFTDNEECTLYISSKVNGKVLNY